MQLALALLKKHQFTVTHTNMATNQTHREENEEEEEEEEVMQGLTSFRSVQNANLALEETAVLRFTTQTARQ